MITSKELTKAIQVEIDLLPASDFTVSIATATDDVDILALTERHRSGLESTCWDNAISKGVAGIAPIRESRVTVLVRYKSALRGMILYQPDNPMCWLHAIAGDATQPMDAQMKAVFVGSAPVHRALLKLGYGDSAQADLITRNFPTDDRLLQFTGKLLTDLKLTKVEHRLSGDQVTVTHQTLRIPIAKTLKMFEDMGL